MDPHPISREEDTVELSRHRLAQLQVRSRGVMERAGLWVARCTQERLETLDVQAQCLALFGLSCALRAAPAERRPYDVLKTAELLVEKLMDSWEQQADGLHAKFRTRTFVT